MIKIDHDGIKFLNKEMLEKHVNLTYIFHVPRVYCKVSKVNSFETPKK